MDGHDQAAHHAEQLQIQHELEQILFKAMHGPLTVEDARLLAWASGITIPKPDTKRT